MALNVHLDDHVNNDVILSCELCDKIFSDKEEWEKHKSREHSSKKVDVVTVSDDSDSDIVYLKESSDKPCIKRMFSELFGSDYDSESDSRVSNGKQSNLCGNSSSSPSMVVDTKSRQGNGSSFGFSEPNDGNNELESSKAAERAKSPDVLELLSDVEESGPLETDTSVVQNEHSSIESQLKTEEARKILESSRSVTPVLTYDITDSKVSRKEVNSLGTVTLEAVRDENADDDVCPVSATLELATENILVIENSFNDLVVANQAVEPQQPNQVNKRCSFCYATFPSTLELAKHKLSVHKKVLPHKLSQKRKKRERPKIFPCKQCPKVFSSTTALTCHMTMHNSVSMLKTTEAPKAKPSTSNQPPNQRIFVKNMSELIAPASKTTASSENWKCSVCERSYVKQSLLLKHMHLYRLQKCTQCDFSACNAMALNKHYDSEHSLDYFRCAYCDFADQSRVSYERHLFEVHESDQVDTDTRSNILTVAVACGLCNKPYSNLKFLKTHLNSEHNMALT